VLLSESKPFPVIAIVGVCASGKSTIVKRLQEAGIPCRHIAQEHSYVCNMWQRLVHPEFLICLDVSFESTIARKQLNWTRAEYDEQLRRISDARDHADLIIDTDAHSIDESTNLIIEGLMTAGIMTAENSGNPPI
jgi:uridine kinase